MTTNVHLHKRSKEAAPTGCQNLWLIGCRHIDQNDTASQLGVQKVQNNQPEGWEIKATAAIAMRVTSQPDPSPGACAACKGRHRKHTCGKGVGISRQRSNNVKWQKLVETSSDNALKVAAVVSTCAACNGKHRKHTCGKGTNTSKPVDQPDAEFLD